MNRFFSKLDLREIRIDPRSSRFPPEVDDVDAGAQTGDGADDPFAVPVIPTADAEAEADRPGDSAEGWREPVTELEPRSDTAAETSRVSVPAANLAGEDDVLKVSARSRPSAVAGAIAGVVREAGRAEVQAIGAGATNQAVKAVAIARDYLHETGIDVICLPAFIDVTINDEDRTAIRLVIEPR